MQKRHLGAHLMLNTKFEAYVVQASINKSNQSDVNTHTLYIETPFSHANRMILLASLLKFNAYNESEDFESVLQGLVRGRAKSYIDDDGNQYAVDDFEYVTNEAEKNQIIESPNYLSGKSILSAMFNCIQHGAISNYTKLPIFLELRNLDEELAAIIGSVNELVLMECEAFLDEHMGHMMETVNQVPLMGYPPKRMMGA